MKTCYISGLAENKRLQELQLKSIRQQVNDSEYRLLNPCEIERQLPKKLTLKNQMSLRAILLDTADAIAAIGNKEGPVIENFEMDYAKSLNLEILKVHVSDIPYIEDPVHSLSVQEGIDMIIECHNNITGEIRIINQYGQRHSKVTFENGKTKEIVAYLYPPMVDKMLQRTVQEITRENDQVFEIHVKTEG